MDLEQYEWPNGTWTSNGSARVDPPTHSGGSGHGVNSNNINLSFQLPYPVDDVQIKFGEYGGNVNLRVNGDHRGASDFQDLHGTLVGAVAVEVHVLPTPCGVLGVLRLRGSINDVAVGGQELWIDDVCYRK